MTDIIVPAEFWKVLRGLLRDESSLAERYLNLQKKEREQFQKLAASDLQHSASERDLVLQSIKQYECKRAEVLRQIGFSGRERISQVIKKYADKDTAHELLDYVERIRKALTFNKVVAQEQAGLLDFVERMTGGLIGLFRSATSGVFKSYTKKGTIFSAYHEQPNQKLSRQL